MELEEYFDFLAPDDIRVKGTRVGIESVLYEYIHCERTPEMIQLHYPALTLEQVYATILYYLRNREKLNAYVTDWLEWGHRMRREQELNPPPFVMRLREYKTTLQTIRANG